MEQKKIKNLEIQGKLGERLGLVRGKCGKTQKEFAEIIGVSMRALKYYEAGMHTPNLTIIYRYTKISEYSFDEIMGYEEMKVTEPIINVELKNLLELKNHSLEITKILGNMLPPKC